MAVTRLPGHRDPIELLRAVNDPDPCSYDHHGTCQAHGQGSDDYCAKGAIRAYLAALDTPTTPEDCIRTEPHNPTATPHDPHGDDRWFVVRITHSTWEQRIVGRHNLRGTADLHAGLASAAAWATGRPHSYDVWASHVHNTLRPEPAPLTARWSNP
jgi:hypothetical protein